MIHTRWYTVEVDRRDDTHVIIDTRWYTLNTSFTLHTWHLFHAPSKHKAQPGNTAPRMRHTSHDTHSLRHMWHTSNTKHAEVTRHRRNTCFTHIELKDTAMLKDRAQWGKTIHTRWKTVFHLVWRRLAPLRCVFQLNVSHTLNWKTQRSWKTQRCWKTQRSGARRRDRWDASHTTHTCVLTSYTTHTTRHTLVCFMRHTSHVTHLTWHTLDLTHLWHTSDTHPTPKPHTQHHKHTPPHSHFRLLFRTLSNTKRCRATRRHTCCMPLRASVASTAN